MKDQLISYVDLLFAGNPHAADIKQEILQNTLDRYDDLIASGKSPEAAYSLAISGIGDISELLAGSAPAQAPIQPRQEAAAPEMPQEKPKKSYGKLLEAIAVFLYILCPVPVMLLQNEIGVCILFLLVAVATVLIILGGKDSQKEEALTPRQKLRRSIHWIVAGVCICIYFVLSFLTRAWQITWLVFPIMAAINGLISACMDLKEAS